MILIIDNGMFASTINYYLGKLDYKTVVIHSSELNSRLIDSLNISGIIISNGNKDNINHSYRLVQNYIWKVPILGVGMGAILLGLLFNAKISDTKIHTLEPVLIHHDGRTIYHNLKTEIISTKWCPYAVSDVYLKKTDLEVSATVEKEIISYRHKNLAIEGILFDITSSYCHEVLCNFVTYYIKK